MSHSSPSDEWGVNDVALRLLEGPVVEPTLRKESLPGLQSHDRAADVLRKTLIATCKGWYRTAQLIRGFRSRVVVVQRWMRRVQARRELTIRKLIKRWDDSERQGVLDEAEERAAPLALRRRRGSLASSAGSLSPPTSPQAGAQHAARRASALRVGAVGIRSHTFSNAIKRETVLQVCRARAKMCKDAGGGEIFAGLQAIRVVDLVRTAMMVQQANAVNAARASISDADTAVTAVKAAVRLARLPRVAVTATGDSAAAEQQQQQQSPRRDGPSPLGSPQASPSHGPRRATIVGVDLVGVRRTSSSPPADAARKDPFRFGDTDEALTVSAGPSPRPSPRRRARSFAGRGGSRGILASVADGGGRDGRTPFGDDEEIIPFITQRRTPAGDRRASQPRWEVMPRVVSHRVPEHDQQLAALDRRYNWLQNDGVVGGSGSSRGMIVVPGQLRRKTAHLTAGGDGSCGDGGATEPRFKSMSFSVASNGNLTPNAAARRRSTAADIRRAAAAVAWARREAPGRVAVITAVAVAASLAGFKVKIRLNFVATEARRSDLRLRKSLSKCVKDRVETTLGYYGLEEYQVHTSLPVSARSGGGSPGVSPGTSPRIGAAGGGRVSPTGAPSPWSQDRHHRGTSPQSGDGVISRGGSPRTQGSTPRSRRSNSSEAPAAASPRFAIRMTAASAFDGPGSPGSECLAAASRSTTPKTPVTAVLPRPGVPAAGGAATTFVVEPGTAQTHPDPAGHGGSPQGPAPAEMARGGAAALVAPGAAAGDADPPAAAHRTRMRVPLRGSGGGPAGASYSRSRSKPRGDPADRARPQSAMVGGSGVFPTWTAVRRAMPERPASAHPIPGGGGFDSGPAATRDTPQPRRGGSPLRHLQQQQRSASPRSSPGATSPTRRRRQRKRRPPAAAAAPPAPVEDVRWLSGEAFPPHDHRRFLNARKHTHANARYAAARAWRVGARAAAPQPTGWHEIDNTGFWHDEPSSGAVAGAGAAASPRQRESQPEYTNTTAAEGVQAALSASDGDDGGGAWVRGGAVLWPAARARPTSAASSRGRAAAAAAARAAAPVTCVEVTPATSPKVRSLAGGAPLSSVVPPPALGQPREEKGGDVPSAPGTRPSSASTPASAVDGARPTPLDTPPLAPLGASVQGTPPLAGAPLRAQARQPRPTSAKDARRLKDLRKACGFLKDASTEAAYHALPRARLGGFAATGLKAAAPGTMFVHHHVRQVLKSREEWEQRVQEQRADGGR